VLFRSRKEMASLAIKHYGTPHQETLSENGGLPTRIHFVVKNSYFTIELAAVGRFNLHPSKVSARLVASEQIAKAPVSHEHDIPMNCTCRSSTGKNNKNASATVVLELKLNVLSSQFTNGVFTIQIDAVDPVSNQSLQVTLFLILTNLTKNITN